MAGQAIFAISLPLETFMAIQSGTDLEPILNQLGYAVNGPLRTVQDITREVVAAAKALPYSVTPRAGPVMFAVTPPVFTPDSAGCVPQAPSYHPSHVPSVATNINITVCAEHWEYPFCVVEDTTAQQIKEMYTKETGIPADTLIFTLEDGRIITSHRVRLPTHGGVLPAPSNKTWDSINGSFAPVDQVEEATVRSLGISNGAVIFVKPRAVQTTRYTTVIFQDLMLREEKITIQGDFKLRELLARYADEINVERDTLTFTYEDEDVIGWGLYKTLDELNITTGTIINVAPKQDITVIFRDLMLNEHRMKVKASDSFQQLTFAYANTVNPHKNLYYVLANGMSTLKHGYFPGRTLKSLGIVDGSIINVHPYSAAPKAFLKKSYTFGDFCAGGGSGNDSQVSRPATPTIAGGWGAPTLSPTASLHSDVFSRRWADSPTRKSANAGGWGGRARGMSRSPSVASTMLNDGWEAPSVKKSTRKSTGGRS